MNTGVARSWRACAFVAPGAPGHARLSTLRERLRSVGGGSAERTLTLVLDRLERDARPERVPPRPDGDASEARRSVTRACGVLVDLAWEKLHTGDWKDVDEAWRDLYVVAAMAAADARGGFAPARAAETLAALDRASLLGGPTFRDELERAIASAQEALAELQTAPSGAKRPRKNARARWATTRATTSSQRFPRGRWESHRGRLRALKRAKESRFTRLSMTRVCAALNFTRTRKKKRFRKNNRHQSSSIARLV